VVDLLKQHHESGRRFEPTEFIEAGPRVAVKINVSDRRWGSEEVEVFKVFTFGEPHDQALTLQDCAGREDAMNHLSAD
jgi:hypothetical protein